MDNITELDLAYYAVNIELNKVKIKDTKERIAAMYELYIKLIANKTHNEKVKELLQLFAKSIRNSKQYFTKINTIKTFQISMSCDWNEDDIDYLQNVVVNNNIKKIKKQYIKCLPFGYSYYIIIEPFITMISFIMVIKNKFCKNDKLLRQITEDILLH